MSMSDIDRLKHRLLKIRFLEMMITFGSSRPVKAYSPNHAFYGSASPANQPNDEGFRREKDGRYSELAADQSMSWCLVQSISKLFSGLELREFRSWNLDGFTSPWITALGSTSLSD